MLEDIRKYSTSAMTASYDGDSAGLLTDLVAEILTKYLEFE